MDIDAWLQSLGLAQYVELFRQNDIDGALLRQLTGDDLKELGIVSLGHRKRILESIANLSSQYGATPTRATPTSAPTSIAERRQLTVMFVDLVDSTRLSSELDPEDMREVIRGYQNAVAGEIGRFEGHVAKFMGDGVLAYFGWPRAHEDEAERAVRAGIAITEAVAQIHGAGQPLACRIGIATGLVVVGDLVGEAEAQGRAVVGATPNLAARLQALAVPGQVVIAEATRRLVGGGFDLASLGRQVVKGMPEPVEPWTVRGVRAVGDRFEARSGPSVRPMVGREQELALLCERWERTTAGEGQAVLLLGEAGIGKSRITRALVDALSDVPHARIRYQGSPYHVDSAFWPVIQQLQRAASLEPTQAMDERLDRLEETCCTAIGEPRRAAAILAPLLGLDGEARYGSLGLSPQALRTRTLGCLVDMLCGVAARRPVLWVVEDAHWLDPSTLELVELCLDRTAALPVLMVLTSRPDNQPRLAGHPHVTRLTLSRLGRAGVEAIIARLTDGANLPAEVVDAIAVRTDGVPLYVEELTKAVLESGDAGIPASLHDSLMARLDRLPEVKAVAQIASVIGRVFEHRSLTAIADRPAAELATALDRLSDAELVFRRGTPPDAQYTFKHALVRDAAYHSLLNERRRDLHHRLADHLQATRDETVEPALLAHHREGAGQLVDAIDGYRTAGRQAFERSANAEAMGHFRAALRVLASVPDLPDARSRELDLLLALGRATFAARSYASEEAAEVYRRARALCAAATDRQQLLQVLTGEMLLSVNRGRYAEGDAISDTMLRLGAETSFLDARLIGLRGSGMCAFWMGRIGEARGKLELLMELCEGEDVGAFGIRYGYDPHAGGAVYLGLALSVLGYGSRAAQTIDMAVDLAMRTKHLHSRGLVLTVSSIVSYLAGHLERQLAQAHSARVLSEEQGFAYFLPIATMMEASALAQTGADPVAARQAAVKAFATWEKTDSVLMRPIYLSILADMHLACDDPDRAGQNVAEALEFAERLGERAFLPEILRSSARLALRDGEIGACEHALRKALATARETEARLFELRAARDLARLWAGQGKRQEARDLLAPIYGWFTEGFDTPDLVEAKTLLDELA